MTMTKEELREREKFAKDHTIKEFAKFYDITYRSAVNFLTSHHIEHKKETKAHGMWHTKLYRKWAAMKTRCTNSKQPGWKNYGGKGITLYPDWNCFSNFAEWALKNGYKDGLTIDRINNNEGYNPGNCRWVTMKAQANNRTNNHFITYKGQTKSLADWCSELNLQYNKTKKRLYAGWSIEKAFEER